MQDKIKGGRSLKQLLEAIKDAELKKTQNTLGLIEEGEIGDGNDFSLDMFD